MTLRRTETQHRHAKGLHTLPPQAIPAGGAAGSAAYLVGVFGPAFIELVLARLRGAKGGADDE